jgi:peptidoglycan/LPS O-acetylase OafA/YrhL
MTPPRHPRYESLDLWRGFACLLVVVFHTSYGYAVTFEMKRNLAEQGGRPVEWLAASTGEFWIGVPLFFVISGYCIAASADSSRRKPNAAGRFFLRRFRRIYPPLWVFLGGTFLAILAMPEAWFPGSKPEGLGEPITPWNRLEPANWLGMITLTEEWRHHFGGPPKGYLMGHLWTLCYEEQFYLVAGLLVLVARRWFFAGVGVVSAGVLLLLATGTVFPGFFFDGLWLAFACGVAVYYRINHATPIIARALDAAIAGVFVMNAGVFRNWVAFQPNLQSYLAVGSAAGLAMAWLHRFDGALTKIRWLAPVGFCGRICYSLYLVHAPITAIVAWNCYRFGITDPLGTLTVTLPLGVGLSVAAGWVFHRWVELRFMNPAGPSGSVADQPASRPECSRAGTESVELPKTRRPDPGASDGSGHERLTSSV